MLEYIIRFIGTMNREIRLFVEGLKKNKNILGIALYGSYAKGTQREDSDVDLMVLLRRKNKQVLIVDSGELTFEINFSTVKEEINSYKNDLDKVVRFWDQAKILYDPEKQLERFRAEAMRFKKSGKARLKDEVIQKILFNFEDQINFISAKSTEDLPTAIFMFNSLVYVFLDQYFDLCQLWKPAPKEILGNLRKVDPDFAEKIDQIMMNSELKVRINVFKEIADDLIRKFN